MHQHSFSYVEFSLILWKCYFNWFQKQHILSSRNTVKCKHDVITTQVQILNYHFFIPTWYLLYFPFHFKTQNDSTRLIWLTFNRESEVIFLLCLYLLMYFYSITTWGNLERKMTFSTIRRNIYDNINSFMSKSQFPPP